MSISLGRTTLLFPDGTSVPIDVQHVAAWPTETIVTAALLDPRTRNLVGEQVTLDGNHGVVARSISECDVRNAGDLARRFLPGLTRQTQITINF